jgi:hypothetical protein
LGTWKINEYTPASMIVDFYHSTLNDNIKLTLHRKIPKGNTVVCAAFETKSKKNHQITTFSHNYYEQQKISNTKVTIF